MKFIRNLLSTFFALAIINSGFSQTNLTFEDALDLTKRQSHVIKQTELLKQEKEHELKSTYGSFFPTISLLGNYSYMSDDIRMDMRPVRNAIVPIYKVLSEYGEFSSPPYPDEVFTQSIREKLAGGLKSISEAEWNKVIQKKQFASINLNATLPIYTGGKLQAKRKAAGLDLEDAEMESKVKRNQLTSELVTRYFGLCLSKQLEKLSKEVVTSMQKHLRDAEKMKENGLMANAEVLQVKVYNAEAERNLKKAERMSEINNKALSATLNDSTERNITPISKLFYLEKFEDLDYFINKAYENNPSLKIVQTKRNLAQIGVRVKTANYLPTVIAMGNYRVWDYDVAKMTPDWMVGVGLNWTIFDGLTREHERKSAKLKLEQVNEFEQKITEDIATGIEKYYQELHINLEQIKELDAAYEFAEEYYRIREKAFNEGISSSSELINANLALIKVKTEKLKAMYQFDVSLANLLEICGISDNFIDYQQHANAKTNIFKSKN